jgi:hypothetical protein
MAEIDIRKLGAVDLVMRAFEVGNVDNNYEAAWSFERYEGAIPNDHVIQVFLEAATEAMGMPPTGISLGIMEEDGFVPVDSSFMLEALPGASDAEKILSSIESLFWRYVDTAQPREASADAELGAEKDKAFELIGPASEMALDFLKRKSPFSLVGFSMRLDGEVVAHHITASSDEEMIDKATKAMALAPTVGFALIGEGKVMDAVFKQTPALFCYFQHRSMEAPAQLLRPYKKSLLGALKLEGEKWTLAKHMDDSWL